ncbi:hypothetical protein [Prevotella sp. 10(H)]|uniref:hypothetical protein n=1 Tax=Prevotella sp. 10(H) TaxID=1158294 RepID=UPI000A509B93|nr:hypothetical protein [Prevotella sp. 10(H)]
MRILVIQLGFRIRRHIKQVYRTCILLAGKYSKRWGNENDSIDNKNVLNDESLSFMKI